MRARTSSLLFLVAAAIPSVAAAQVPALTVDGTEFVLTLEDGRVLRSADLVGATLMIGTGDKQTAVIIKSVEEDPFAVGGRVFLHRFVVKDDRGNESDLCTADATGRNLGFPVPDGKGAFELTCTSGAIGKCIRWGYRFWEEQPGGPPLRAMHQACIHMARADYGGDGSTFTRDGTMIDICDRFGVQRCQWAYPIPFEAAWGADGATCVAHPRIAELTTLEALREKYPALDAHLGPDACSRETAVADPNALLFNRSEE
jgi:hypothetical protein